MRWPARPSPCTTTASIPRVRLGAVRRRGCAAAAYRPDRGRRACAPTSTTPTRPTAAAAASTGNAAASGYRSQPSVSASNLIVAPGELSLRASCLSEAGEGVLVTDVAGLHSGVNPVPGVFSVGASGRAIRGGELAEPLREFTIASDLVSMLRAVRRPARRRAGCLSAARSARRRCSSARWPSRVLRPCGSDAVAAVRLRADFNYPSTEELRRDKG